MLCHISSKPFQPVCFSDANNMYKEFQDLAMTLIDNHYPRRTWFRQSLPHCIAAATSNQIKILNTQRIRLATRPTTYRKKLRALEAEVLKNCEANRIAYQENVFGTRNTNEIFRHLKNKIKAPRIPKTVKYKEEPASTTQSKTEPFNSFFHYVFAAEAHFTVNRYKN